MTDSALQRGDIDAVGLQEDIERDDAWLEAENQIQAPLEAQEQQEVATDAQFKAEQADPRNKEDWGMAGVVKELQSAFLGGTQDTASSIVTLGERVLDTASGEIQREQQTEEGYQTEWDDFFVDEANPIETKTWWGGLIRSATHFGTMGLAIVKAAPVLGVGAAAAGGGRVVTAVGGLVANQWARAAAVGAATDLVSKYSQDANALQILRDRYGFIDTPLTTNDLDHPTVKTFKNVVEGMGIGELANGLFRIMGKGMKRVRPGRKLGEEVIEDGTELALEKGQLRSQSVADETVEAGQLELFERGSDFGGHKNVEGDSWQGAPTSKDNVMDVRDAQRRTRTEWGAENGSPGSVTTPVQLQRAAKTSGLSEETINEVFKELVSEPRYTAEVQAVRAGQKTMKQVWGDAIEQFQRTGLGREAAEIPSEQYLAEYFQGAHRYFADTPDEMIAWTSKNVVAGDLLIGSLMREIRDLGIAGRELGNIADLGDIDAPAKALFDKLITATTEVKRSRLLQSQEFRNLGAGRFEATDATPQKEWLEAKLSEQVGESIDAYRLALNIAGESDNDDLFKAIFETVSMSNDIHNLTDFDNFLRTKLKGGELKGNYNKGILFKELDKVFINSVLSGPKTPARAIIGTSTATFMRPLATTLGAAIRYPFTGDGTTVRASLAAVNAMRESIPEAWQLFKTRLNSYWTGDIATVKSRYAEFTKGDQHWDMYRHWIEESGRATDGDKAAFFIANQARAMNDSKFLTYSTKLMAATDDTFGFILSRAKAREKAYFDAMQQVNKGQITEITPEILMDGQKRFYNDIVDADGNIRLDTDLGKNVEFARREVTLTQDLTGFSKGLADVMEKSPWTKPFFLFARTGVNGLTLTAKHTPGFNFLVKEFNDIARASVNDLSAVAKYGISTPEDLINAKALQTGRLAIGTGVISMAAMHFMNGGLTGNGPTDRQKRQVWLDAGWVPRGINIGGGWGGYDSFEPFNQILSGIADVGDHSQLMGEEWTQDQFQKYSLLIAQSVASKSYLSGIQQFVDLFAGKPGQQNRIIAGLLNNTVPLAGLRNELGKLFTPHTSELGSSIGDSIRNRNLITEKIAVDPIPVKYDMLNGQPLREHDFVTRMWNTFIPIPLNLDQGPGRKLLFDSGYDLRLSTYYGPDGTDLTESPALRSEFQRYIGRENLELKLNKLAADPRVQESLARMQADLRAGRKEIDPMKAYLHNQLIKAAFDKARRQAWAKMLKVEAVRTLIADQESIERLQRQRLKETSVLQLQNK